LADEFDADVLHSALLQDLLTGSVRAFLNPPEQFRIGNSSRQGLPGNLFEVRHDFRGNGGQFNFLHTDIVSESGGLSTSESDTGPFLEERARTGSSAHCHFGGVPLPPPPGGGGGIGGNLPSGISFFHS